MTQRQSSHTLLIFLLILAVTCISCKKQQTQQPQKQAGPVSVDALVLTPVSFVNDVEASGSILANEFVSLRPEISGRITSLNIPEGNYVRSGTVLATLFNDDLKAELQKEQSQLTLAQQTEQRLKKLLEAEGTSQQEYDNALNAVNSLKADIDATNAQIRKTIIAAPFSGTVGLRNVSIGAFVSPQDVITTIQETGQMKIDFTVPENLSPLVKKNGIVSVETEGDTILHLATVIAIEPAVSISTRNIKARAVFKEKNLKVNAGSFAKVLLNATNTAQSIIVPSNAIIPDSKGDLLVLIKDGKANFQLVETGERSSGWVQILGGAQPGDTVAVNGVLYLKPNGPVKINSLKTYDALGYFSSGTTQMK